ncbi:MAG: RNA-guided endonuclease InsQ/TnpB family protein [Candidatus Weimeria sp.]
MLIGRVVRLQPNKEQEAAFRRFAGTNRFAWNTCKAYYDKTRMEKHEYASISDMMKHLQDMKHNDLAYAWLNDVPEAITKQAIKDLHKAYQKYYKDRKTMKPDPKHPDKGKPRFKKKYKCQESFYQRTDNIHKIDDIHIKITGIKKPVKCAMLRGIDLPEHIQNPRITYDGKYWYLSYSYEIAESNIVSDYDRETLGIDLGIKDFAILSDGQHFRNINKDPKVRKLRKRLKHLQREVSRKYEANCTTDKNGKKIYHKTNNIKKIEQQIRLIYRKITNIWTTYMYEVAKAVAKTKPQTIVIEDLNIKGMMQNPHLARTVAEENFYKFRQILTYKGQMNGIAVKFADRWYPSSKKCSCCGNIKHDLKLSDRTYHCLVCGFTIDRDENAAINLERCDRFKKIAVA